MGIFFSIYRRLGIIRYHLSRNEIVIVMASGVLLLLLGTFEEQLKRALLLLVPEYYQNKVELLTDVKDVDLSRYENQTAAELADLEHIPYLHADPTDDTVLRQAGIGRAAGLAAVLPDDRDNLLIIIGARTLADKFNNPNLRIMARSEQLKNIRKMYFSGADDVRLPISIGGGEMALHLAHPEIGNWWHARLLGKSDRVHFAQIYVGEQRPLWIGKTVADIHASEGLLLLAIKRNGDYLSPPSVNTKLQADDIAITFGQLESTA